MTEIEYELYHHGVKGMKWGKRKDKYVTVRQGMKNARTAGQDAWRKSVSDNGGKLVGRSKQIAVYKNPADKFRGKKAANTAYNDAYRESLKSDKAYNKQLRSEKGKKVAAKLSKVLNKKVSAVEIAKGVAITSGILSLASSGALMISELRKS